MIDLSKQDSTNRIILPGIYLGQYASAMLKLHLLASVSIGLGLWAVVGVSAQEPSPGSAPGGSRSERQKEVPIILGAEVLTSMECLEHVYPLIAGDWISIRVLGRRPGISCQISPSGAVNVPSLGSIKAAGLTSKELAFKVKAGLEEKKILPEAHVVVALDRPSPASSPARFGACRISETVVVLGAVVKPGRYELPENGLTLSVLLRQAGGQTSAQKAPKILIQRKTPQGNKRILVNTWAALNENRSDYDLFLRRDDVIMVE